MYKTYVEYSKEDQCYIGYINGEPVTHADTKEICRQNLSEVLEFYIREDNEITGYDEEQDDSYDE
jgi:predicted RNase H-like HicB family nuclease